MKDFSLKQFGVLIFIGVCVILLCFYNALYLPDTAVSDFLCQRPSATDGNIMVIGIDQKALDELGPMPWSRSVFANAIETLNSDPENQPAVIGVDVLFIGESDWEADQKLITAAGMYDNVVLAQSAEFGTGIAKNNNKEYINDFYVTAWNEPFSELKEVTSQGHINAMLDVDGVLRHSLLYVNIDGIKRPSFAWTIAEKYSERTGLEINEPITDRRGFWYLPYTALPGGYYEDISVTDIVNERIDPSYFKDKIVLIGPYSVGLQDDNKTPVDYGKKMYGIEFQANCISAILDGNYKKEISDRIQIIILIIISLFSALLFSLRKVLKNTILWAIVCLGWVGVCILCYGRGMILHVTWVPLAETVLFGASLISGYLYSAKEKRKISGLFSRYVDPSIIDELLKKDSESLGLGGKLCDIAVLFVDVRGFTGMSEKIEPKETVEILNRYYSLTTSCILKNHGTVDKFIGDCTMAIWNAPLSQDDYVLNACKAALDMVSGSKEFCEEMESRYGRKIGFGIGVNCGKAVVGNIGTEMRMDYTAIGDTVNTASRLESNSPAGCIYISKSVVDTLGSRIKVERAEHTIALKGKSEQVEIFLLKGLEDS